MNHWNKYQEMYYKAIEQRTKYDQNSPSFGSNLTGQKLINLLRTTPSLFNKAVKEDYMPKRPIIT
jgi:hypothetical protein